VEEHKDVCSGTGVPVEACVKCLLLFFVSGYLPVIEVNLRGVQGLSRPLKIGLCNYGGRIDC
jgi:hypothetical protein